MRVCSLGDLVLDVIVRLRQPLAPGRRHARRRSPCRPAARRRTWRPGSRRSGGSARWLGKRADDDAGRLAAAQLERATGSSWRPDRTRGQRRRRLARRTRTAERSMFPDRGVATELSRATISIQPLARGLRLAARLGLRAPPRSRRRSRRRSRGTRARRRRLGQRRPLLVERDPRPRARALPRRARGARARRRVRQRGRGAGARRPAARPLGGSSSAAPRAARSRASSGPRWRSSAVVDTTGAGDALAAGWLVGGPALALEAAARCVQRAGSMPLV